MGQGLSCRPLGKQTTQQRFEKGPLQNGYNTRWVGIYWDFSIKGHKYHAIGMKNPNVPILNSNCYYKNI